MRNLIDLHLHVDGSIGLAAARRLAKLGGIDVTGLTDAGLWDRLSVGSDGCADLNEYLSKFDFPLRLVQTREQIVASVRLLQEDLLSRGFAYAELRFAPQSQTRAGLTQREVIEASLEGLRACEFDARLILCCMRGTGNEAANEETVRLAAEHLGDEVVAVDLAGAEGLFPTAGYAGLFALARRLGVPFTIHAGEAAGPESVAAALDFGAARIGHGVRAAEDPAVVRRLAESGVPLEVCPTSEVHTGVFGTLGELPLRELMAAGVRVTINSDNMSVSDTDVAAEFSHLHRELGLSDAEERELRLNAVDASFADRTTKARLRRSIMDEYETGTDA